MSYPPLISEEVPGVGFCVCLWGFLSLHSTSEKTHTCVLCRTVNYTSKTIQAMQLHFFPGYIGHFHISLDNFMLKSLNSDMKIAKRHLKISEKNNTLKENCHLTVYMNMFLLPKAVTLLSIFAVFIFFVFTFFCYYSYCPST